MPFLAWRQLSGLLARQFGVLDQPFAKRNCLFESASAFFGWNVIHGENLHRLLRIRIHLGESRAKTAYEVNERHLRKSGPCTEAKARY